MDTMTDSETDRHTEEQPMARRRRQKQSPFEDLIEIIAVLPSWVSVLLAILAYFWLHHFAVTEVAHATTIATVGGAVVGQAFKSFAFFGQYLLPGIFLIGAVVSAARRGKDIASAVGTASMAPISPRMEPAVRRTTTDNLYEVWKWGKNAESPRADQWNLDLLRAIDWKRFEEVCAEYFRLCGFHATTQSNGPDGGIDIKLYAPKDTSKIVNIVQCKQWKRPVGPKAVREFLGVMTASKLSRGVFVTTSIFNDEATRFATENRIHLLDGQQFFRKIQKRTIQDQARLLKVATDGDYLTPSCPSCGIKLLKRENRKDQSTFWGCASFPRCRFTLR